MRWTVTAAAAVGILVAAVIVRTQVIDTVTVSSDSMAPTVCTGDTVLLMRLGDGAAIDVDDIVTFPSPTDGQPAIKRVVAIAGETVAIQDAELIVDGRRVQEPYVDHASIDGVYTATVTVPQGSVFVMGDHREISIDSREYGPVPTSIIDGRMVMKLWSACTNP
jgi:signal peptidase I